MKNAASATPQHPNGCTDKFEHRRRHPSWVIAFTSFSENFALEIIATKILTCPRLFLCTYGNNLKVLCCIVLELSCSQSWVDDVSVLWLRDKNRWLWQSASNQKRGFGAVHILCSQFHPGRSSNFHQQPPLPTSPEIGDITHVFLRHPICWTTFEQNSHDNPQYFSL